VKTLDKYIVRNFLTTAFLFFVVMMMLRIVSDLFVNIDEWLEEEQAFGEKVQYLLSYYGYNSLAYFIELGGVIIVAAAVFTLARMNRSNELTAMLASGVSLHRVTLPIVLCAMVMGGLIILDQELVIPNVAHKLIRKRDETSGGKDFAVRLMADGAGNVWYSRRYSPARKEMTFSVVQVRDAEGNVLASASGELAHPHQWRRQRGWLMSRGRLARPEGQVLGGQGRAWPNMPNYQRVYSSVSPTVLLEQARRIYHRQKGVYVVVENITRYPGVKIQDADYRGLTIRAKCFKPVWTQSAPADGARTVQPGGYLERPAFTFVDGAGRTLGTFLANSAQWRTDEQGNGYWQLTDGALFFPSDMTPEKLVLWRSGAWMHYMSTSDLARLISLKRVPDRQTAELIKHIRFTAPISNLVMLLLGLPFILSRERNIKASAALCLLIVGAFFVLLHACRQLDMNPLLAAWLPIFVFGPITIVMLDSVKT